MTPVSQVTVLGVTPLSCFLELPLQHNKQWLIQFSGLHLHTSSRRQHHPNVDPHTVTLSFPGAFERGPPCRSQALTLAVFLWVWMFQGPPNVPTTQWPLHYSTE